MSCDKDLHRGIIGYITTGSRIMHSRDLPTWDDFHMRTEYQFADNSLEQLRSEFLHTILPRILTYNLDPIQLRKVEVFANHYQFERTADGFRELDAREPYRIYEGVHYVTEATRDKFPSIACVITKSVERAPRVDAKIVAWASAINSSDEEIAHYRIFHGSDLQQRVQRTRNDFRETGRFPHNMRPDIGQKIVSYVKKFEELESLVSNEDYQIPLE